MVSENMAMDSGQDGPALSQSIYSQKRLGIRSLDSLSIETMAI